MFFLILKSVQVMTVLVMLELIPKVLADLKGLRILEDLEIFSTRFLVEALEIVVRPPVDLISNTRLL